MEPDRALPPAMSRRALREYHQASRRRISRSAVATWLPRTGLLLALAAATIAVPVIDTVAPQLSVAGEALNPADFPSAQRVLAGDTSQPASTALLAAVPQSLREAEFVSRSLERSALPGCDGVPVYGYANGQIPTSALCKLWDPSHMLRADAAVTLAELHEQFRAAFGRDICLSDSYRSLGEQYAAKARRGYLAATPGTSNHGWGLAIDLCSSDARGEVYQWLTENAPAFGWENPPWARRGGSGPYEPWHWEYLPGTTELGTNWSSARGE